MRARFRVGDSYLRHSSKHCTFDGQECWHARTHPMISEISASEGYTSGGQEIEISGHGLDGASVSVQIDGVDCQVTRSANDKIICVTG